MTKINKLTSGLSQTNETNVSTESFNDTVLHYLQKNKPKDNLSSILNQLRALAPDQHLLLSQLSEALLYSDTYMRSTVEDNDYATEVLDKRASQILGVNMLFNKMMDKLRDGEDDDSMF